MSTIYYLGGPCDLTKQVVDDEICYRGYIRIPIMPKMQAVPVSKADYENEQSLYFKVADYKIRRVDMGLFIGIYQGDE